MVRPPRGESQRAHKFFAVQQSFIQQVLLITCYVQTLFKAPKIWL